jgi:hypothetical protein
MNKYINRKSIIAPEHNKSVLKYYSELPEEIRKDNKFTQVYFS